MFSVTQNGKPLDPSLYIWDEKTKTFSTNENNLVLDFSGYNGVTFKTFSYCTFTTGSDCTFNTGSYCTFDTGSGCTFKTGYGCIFTTGHFCTFDTGSCCTFKTVDSCTFTTGHNCFVTRWDVTGCIEIPVGKTIKLNKCGMSGYTVVEEPKPTYNGKVVEIDGKKYKLVETT